MVKNLTWGLILARLAQILAPDIFSWFLPLLDIRHCRKLSLYTISRKMFNPNSRKWGKTSFWAWFRLIGPKFGPPIFLKKNLALSVTRYHGHLSSYVQYQKKTNDPIARKFCEGRTDGRTDGHGREWFQRKLSDWSWAPNILRELNLIFSWVSI